MVYYILSHGIILLIVEKDVCLLKLKTRLVIAFLIIIVLPMGLSLAVITGFSQYQISMIEKNYNITGTTYKSFSNPVNMLNKVTSATFHKLVKTAKTAPETLTDITYLEKINEELTKKNSYLVVRRDDKVVYIGAEAETELLQELPAYGDYDSSSESGVYLGGDLQVLVKQIDFEYQDGAQGSAFIVTDVSDSVPEVKQLITDMVIAVVFILMFTALFLILWIYRGIVIPLGRMKIATQNIKDGNLDFELEIEADDEIGQLCRDFEEMRKRLKDTAEEKVEYDRKSKELISNISHDLKTPITAIKGYVEGIMDGVADTPEKMDRYIKTIYNKANEMDLLINELTLYSKIDTNRIPYNFATISAEDYFGDCAEDLHMELEAKGVGFSYRNEIEEDSKVIVDPEQLRRVINNIISNSLKYMDKEQGIIGQEIRMIEDQPGWQAYHLLLEALYQYHPVRNSVAGSVESIAEITAETLYQCHEAFYTPPTWSFVWQGM